MRVFALWYDCNVLLHVVSQQHLQKPSHLFYFTNMAKFDEGCFCERPLLTCAGLRLCFSAISATTGSSRILCGSPSLFNLKRRVRRQRAQREEALNLRDYYRGYFNQQHYFCVHVWWRLLLYYSNALDVYCSIMGSGNISRQLGYQDLF